MEQSKKAIGFFVSLAFLAFGILLFFTKQIEPFSDFALLEWQMKLANQGIFHLPYENQVLDPNYHLFPLPSAFFYVHNGFAFSTFPNLYPILFSPIYTYFGFSGIKLAQIFLFLFSIFLFYQIKQDDLSVILLLFGSTISIYLFLIHETIFFFFLEIWILYLYGKRHIIFSGFLSVCLVWMRPEMIFSILFIPFCFSKDWDWKGFFTTVLCTGISFSITQQITFGTYLPLRLIQNSKFEFHFESSLYLFKIWMEQVPIFLIFLIFLIRSTFRKQIFYPNFIILILTFLILIITPNTGGHNTPRYLFGLIPLYILLLRKNTNIESKISKRWILLCLALSIYSLMTLWNQTKELKKISKFQRNTLEELSKVKNQVFVFNNSDFAFVALPLLDEKKNLLLLQSENHKETLLQILEATKSNSFTFLELPPSPIPIGETLKVSGITKDIEFHKMETLTLPNALLPINVTTYQR